MYILYTTLKQNPDYPNNFNLLIMKQKLYFLLIMMLLQCSLFARNSTSKVVREVALTNCSIPIGFITFDSHIKLSAVLTPTPTANSPQVFCSSATIANLTASGTNVQWYAAAVSGLVLPTSTPLVNGTTYFATQTIAGLESASRTAVLVNIIDLSTISVATVANQVVCRSASSTAVNFTGTPVGAIFRWTNSNPAIGLAASGTGNIAAFTASNTTNAPISSTVTVTPAFGTSTITQIFSFTGAMQTFTVPAGITSLNIEAFGAAGAAGSVGSQATALGGLAGKGGQASGTLAVTPGQVININVGGAAAAAVGGYNGGGNGGSSNGGGGGGASDIRVGGSAIANSVIVASGGGGGGTGGYLGFNATPLAINGGNGGNSASNGTNGVNSATGGGGFGGTATAGGALGVGCPLAAGIAGASGVSGIGGNGGNGSTCCGTVNPGGGGGGGGFVGGGGGGGGTAGTTMCAFNDTGAGGGGAGGSSYTAGAGVTAGSVTQGVQSGNGLVTITYSILGLCSGTPKTFNYTINPTPVVTQVSNIANVCAGATVASTTFSSPTTGGTIVYNWTNNNTNIGLAASGTGNLPSFTATNTTASPITASITVTPTYTNASTSCIGTAMIFSISVNSVAAPVAASSQTFCTGATVVSLTATGMSIKWYDVATGGVAVASSTALVSGNYFASQANASGCESISRTQVAVILTPTTSIVTQPIAQAICATGNATFAVAASGTNLTYQWQVKVGAAAFVNLNNSAVVSGATTASLTLTTVSVAMNTNQYQCIVFGTCGVATTTAVALTVNIPSSITTQPTAQVICATGNATFAVAASGTNLTYQWQEKVGAATFANISNGGVYGGATTASLTLTNVPTTMSTNQYQCIVSGTCSVATTTAVALTVNATSITTQPTAQAICATGSATFAVVASGTSLTYQWQEKVGVAAFVNLNNSAVVSGATSASLTLTAVTTAMSTNQYQCVVSGTCGVATTTAVALTVNIPSSITTQPTAQVICATGNATFAVAASGTNLTYQWQEKIGVATFANISNSGVYSGTTTASLSLTNVPTTMSTNQYQCIVSGTCGVATTTAVALTVNALSSIITQPTLQTVCAGNNAIFAVSASGTSLAYQWQVKVGAAAFVNLNNSAVVSGANSASLTLTAVSVAMNTNQYQCIVSGTCGVATTTAVALTVNATSITTQPTAQVICATGNATFAVVASGTSLTYQWQEKVGAAAFVNLNNNANVSGANSASLTLTAVTSTMNTNQYQCIVSGTCGVATTTAVALTVNMLSSITTQPTAQVICATGNATFAVAASGTNLTYQWQEKVGAAGFANVSNGGIYGGATSASLTLTNVPTTVNTNQYQCVVSGTCGVATTTAVALTVNAISATPTAMAQQFLPSGSTVANLVANGTTIKWYAAATGGSALVNNTVLVNGTSYFASQTSGTCESARIPVRVTITATAVAINFDGTNDFMKVNNNSLINFTTSMTVEFWVKRNVNTSNFNFIVGKSTPNTWTNGYSISFSGTDKINFAPQGWTGDTATNVFSTSTIPLNTWTHVAGTFDGITAKLYINGNLDTSIPLTGAIPNNTFDLFFGSDNGGNYFGKYDLDMVRLWNTARTQAQIAASINSCVPASTSGLVAQYDFEESAGSTAFQDTSGNGLHGSYNNMETADWISGATCATTYLSVASNEFNATVKVYPNPSNSIFNIEIDANATINVVDMLGKQIMSKKIQSGNSQIDLSDYAQGIYLMKITNELNQQKTIKLVKN